MVVVLALLSAGANAASTVMQRRAAAAAPPETALHLSLIGYLVHRRVWLAGMAAMVLSFLLQALALRFGPLTVVQPILVAKLPLTLLLALALLGGARYATRRDTVAVLALSAGLGLVLGLTNPTDTSRTPSALMWWLVAVLGGLGLLALTAAASRLPVGAARAALLGTASGVAFGYTAVFMKALTDSLQTDAAHLVTSWPAYAVAVTGIVAVLLQQNALQAGSLAASQPASTIAGPVVSVLIGILVLGEDISGASVWPLTLVGLVAVVAGVVALAHSPLATATAVGAASGAPTAEEQPGS